MNSEHIEPKAEGYRLAYPLYLDQAMMTSFLAHLEGGYSSEEQITNSAGGGVERFRKMSGRFGFRFGVADAQAEGERSSNRTDTDSTEVTFQRAHTSASLFNLLYEYLSDDGMLAPFAGLADLDVLSPGLMVEISCRYEGNGFEDNIAAAAAFVPYLEEISEAEGNSGESGEIAPKSRSSNPERRRAERKQNASSPPRANSEEASQVAGMRIATRMTRESGSSAVRDLVVRTSEDFAVILTVSSEYYDERVKGLLRDGEFRVVGKVTRIRREGEDVRLSRRAAVGALGRSITQDMIDGLLAGGIDGGAASENVEGPSLQVMPMAIFI